MTKSVFIILRVDPEFKKKVLQKSGKMKVSVSELVRSLIEDQI